jgi:hypothetical protein
MQSLALVWRSLRHSKRFSVDVDALVRIVKYQIENGIEYLGGNHSRIGYA